MVKLNTTRIVLDIAEMVCPECCEGTLETHDEGDLGSDIWCINCGWVGICQSLVSDHDKDLLSLVGLWKERDESGRYK